MLPRRRLWTWMFWTASIPASLGCGDQQGADSKPVTTAQAGNAGAAGASGAGAGGGTAETPRKLGLLPLYYSGNEAPFEAFDAGATLLVRRPPQGGFVLWIGAEVTGAEGEQLEIRGRLRSVSSGAIVAEESRSITVAPTSPGSDAVRPFPVSLRNTTNLPVCPNYGDEELLGIPLELEIRVEDLSKEPFGIGEIKIPVQLTCPDGFPSCPCECSLGYVLGLCSSPDNPP